MKETNLILGIHANFPSEIKNIDSEPIFQYLVFLNKVLDLLISEPNLKINFHLTKNVLSYGDKTYPDFYSKLSKLIEKNQIELISGGLYEPLFSLIPREDRQVQIKLMTRLLNHNFGITPLGAYLPEYDWDPSLPIDLSKSRILYTFLPEKYFQESGISTENAYGYFTTEDEGRITSLFCINSNVEDLLTSESSLIELIQNSQNQKVKILFLNKFLSSDKYENFLSLLKNIVQKEELKTNLFFDYFSKNPPTGRVYIPGKDQASRKHWKSYLTDQMESNFLHKKMMRVSKKINAAKEGKSRFKVIKEMINNSHDLLLKGQRSSFYFNHPLGGIYTANERSNAYSSLIKAENLIEQASSQRSNKLQVLELDYDSDGHEEILIETDTQNIYITPYYSGGIIEHDYLPKEVNLINTIAPENEKSLKINIIEQVTTQDFDSRSLQNNNPQIHYKAEKVKAKEQTWKVSMFNEQPLSEHIVLNIQKSLSSKINDNNLYIGYELSTNASEPIIFNFCIEFNFNFFRDLHELSVFNNELKKVDFTTGGTLLNTNSFHLMNEKFQLALNIVSTQNFNLTGFPILTKNNSFQGISLFAIYKITLSPREIYNLSLIQNISEELQTPEFSKKEEKELTVNS